MAFNGFPLHPAGKPSAERAAHLREVNIPMLLLQGTRDEFAKLELLQPLIDRLGAGATLGRDAGRARGMDRKRPLRELSSSLFQTAHAYLASMARRMRGGRPIPSYTSPV